MRISKTAYSLAAALTIAVTCMFAAPAAFAAEQMPDAALNAEPTSTLSSVQTLSSSDPAAESIFRLTGDQATTSGMLPVVFECYIDQPTSREVALAYIREYRAEAWDTPEIHALLDIPEGMTREEYIDIDWNIDLERICIQRGGEQYWTGMSHTRPNGDSCFTAWSNGSGSSSEIIATGYIGYPQISFQLWYSEKQAFISSGGQWSASTGHYAAMVSPSYKSFAFATVYTPSGYAYGVGEFRRSTGSDESIDYTGYYYSTAWLPQSSVSDLALRIGAEDGDEVSLGEYAGMGLTGTVDGATTTLDITQGTLEVVGGDTSCISVYLDSDYGQWVIVPNHSGTATVRLTIGDRTVTRQVSVPKWTRLWGNVALDTMSRIVNAGWSGETGGSVIVATIDGYWDALTASGLAGMTGAPVLMTASDSLSSQTMRMLGLLKPAHVYVVGGSAAVADSVLTQIEKATGVAPERIAGATATGTANKIYSMAESFTGKTWGKTAFVATNDGYWDALAIAPYAYKAGCPVFLTEGKDSISEETLSNLANGGFTEVYVLGGTAAVSDGVVAKLAARGIEVTDRLAGDTAITTSQRICEFELAHGMTADGMGLATVDGYWDALTGAALCGKNNAVLGIVADANSTTITQFVKQNKGSISSLYLFGGRAALSDAVGKAVSSALA